jgi:hypothetical protein
MAKMKVLRRASQKVGFSMMPLKFFKPTNFVSTLPTVTSLTL